MRSLVFGAVGAAALTGAAQATDVSPLVDDAWLADHLGQADLVVLDIRNAIDGGSADTFTAGHIPGSVHSDYLRDGWRAERDGVVGMLPPVADLETLIGALGIDNDDHVVIVPAGTSSTDFGSATRVYWTFQVLGHDAVSILDGGFAGWQAAGLSIELGPVTPEPATFVASFRPELLATAADVRAAVADGGVTLVDARPAAQYRGEDAHQAAARPGTLTGAVNVEQQTLVSPDGAQALRGEPLDALLAAAGVSRDAPQIAFCNTGHWASIAWFAASELAGHDDVRLYDGSMVEWTGQPDNDVEVHAIN